MTKILVTGGGGFIGSNLIKMAVRDVSVDDIVVIDDFSTGVRSNLAGLPVRVVEGSILDRDSLLSALDRVDVVIHLAAIPSVPRSLQDPLSSHAANASGTLEVLESCRASGVSRIIGASSSSVYGLNAALPKHEREWVRPLSPYGVSKLAAEQYLLAYQSSFAMNSLAFRFFNVYGPGQLPGHAYAAVVPVFLDALLSNRPIPLHGDGSQSRDFTFVGTVCQILLSAAVRSVSHPEPVNLAFGTRTDLSSLIQSMEIATGKRAKVELLPARVGDVAHSQADNTVLRSLFPDVSPVSLIEGLRVTAEWLTQRKMDVEESAH